MIEKNANIFFHTIFIVNEEIPNTITAKIFDCDTSTLAL